MTRHDPSDNARTVSGGADGMKPVAILGAGLAGLVAARELKRRGIPVILFEAAKVIGGLAGSYKDAEGFSYDMGAHFVSNRLARELDAETICRTVTRYGEAVQVGDRRYGYPFRPAARAALCGECTCGTAFGIAGPQRGRLVHPELRRRPCPRRRHSARGSLVRESAEDLAPLRGREDARRHGPLLDAEGRRPPHGPRRLHRLFA